MDNFTEIGRYIQKRLREKKISDDDVAQALNISPKTVQKIYPSKEIPSERLSIFCILLNENIFSNFYGQSEPLRSVLNAEIDELKKEIDLLKVLNDKNEEIISLQRKVIAQNE